MTAEGSSDPDGGDVQLCRACGARRPERDFEVLSWRDRSSHRLFECLRCGSLNLVGFIDPTPYYVEDYPSFAARTPPPPSAALRLAGTAALALTSTRRGASWSQPLDRVLPSWVRWLRGFGLRTDSHLVDVGSGSGALLLHLARFGFDHLTGLDPYLPEDLDWGPVQIRRAGIETFGERADALVFNHSLEHVDDPSAQLRAAATCLRGDGPVVVRLPVAGSRPWRRYRDNWADLDAPLHRCVPTIDGMHRLAERAGFEVRAFESYSTPWEYEAGEAARRGIPLDEVRATLTPSERRWLASLAKHEHGTDGATGTFVLARARRGGGSRPTSGVDGAAPAADAVHQRR